jgi:uncharacterized membrane protein YqaE (UPF0057 family)
MVTVTYDKVGRHGIKGLKNPTGKVKIGCRIIIPFLTVFFRRFKRFMHFITLLSRLFCGGRAAFMREVFLYCGQWKRTYFVNLLIIICKNRGRPVLAKWWKQENGEKKTGNKSAEFTGREWIQTLQPLRR